MLNTLTGRRRYRVAPDGALILQTEWAYWDGDADRWGRWRCEFMDATANDVMPFELTDWKPGYAQITPKHSALLLADRMEQHVRARLPGPSPVIENGAWQMMLDAATALREAHKQES